MKTWTDRMVRTLSTAAVLCMMIAGTLLLMGSALTQPPLKARGFEFSAATALIANGVDTLVDLQATNVGPTASILVINDNAGGGTDLLMSMNTSTAPAPTATTISTTFRIKPGNQFNIDGRWTGCAMRGDGGTVAARIVATY